MGVILDFLPLSVLNLLFFFPFSEDANIVNTRAFQKKNQ